MSLLGLPERHPRIFRDSFTRSILPIGQQPRRRWTRSSARSTVDAVVNNVGFARFGVIGSIDLDHLFDTYDLNVRTAVQVVQAVLPGMRAAGWGRIVNVTSLTTLGTPERTPYAAAKAALETCTRIWAKELASDRHHGERGGAGSHRNRDVSGT